MSEPFKIGDRVEWVSEPAGTRRHMPGDRGVVTKVGNAVSNVAPLNVRFDHDGVEDIGWCSSRFKKLPPICKGDRLRVIDARDFGLILKDDLVTASEDACAEGVRITTATGFAIDYRYPLTCFTRLDTAYAVPATLAPIITAIEDILLKGDRDAKQLWALLTALRGPDEDGDDKTLTRAVRCLMFPRMAEKARELYFPAAFGLTPEQAAATLKEATLDRFKHFESHIQSAQIALEVRT